MGRRLSEETKRKISAMKKEFYKDPENRRRASEAQEGKVFTEEHRRKISEALKGKKRPRTIEHIRKLADALRGKKGPSHSVETRRKIALANMGENNPAWRGGTSFEPYGLDFTDVLKEQIRQRQNHKCLVCGLSGNGRALDVHHRDYDKVNNDPGNLVALCPSCHGATNTNRKYWQSALTNLVSKRTYPSCCLGGNGIR